MTARAVVALTVVLLLAACGGSSSGNKRLTHAQLVAKVDQLCADATKQVAKIPQAPGDNLHQIERFAFHLQAIQENFMAQTRKLKPPVRDEALWRKALAYNALLNVLWRRIREAAVRRDARAVQSEYRHLQQVALNPYYRRLGMKGC